MDSLPAATSIARALLTLARSSATGVLELRGPVSAQRARVAIVAGTPRGVEPWGAGDEPLGDLLARDGAFDAEAHARALASSLPEGPVGAWLVREGVASPGAVAQALRTQLRARMRALFAWDWVELRFHEGRPEVAVPCVDEPVRAGDLVLEGLRGAVAAVPVARVRAQLGDGVLRLSPLGEALLAGVPLAPEEEAMVALLRRGAPVPELLMAGAGTVRAHRCLLALKLVHAAAPPRPGVGAYTTLLRKTRQLRATQDPDLLLDLPRGSRPEQARHALRRLAKDLHPDRFVAGSDPAIRQASNEVLSALVRAEAELQRRPPVSGGRRGG